MVNSKTWLAVALALAVATQVSAQTEKGRAALTAADRAEIEVLNARYSLSLGMCNAEVWPYLFAPDGYFASASRGKVIRLREECMRHGRRRRDGPAA